MGVRYVVITMPVAGGKFVAQAIAVVGVGFLGDVITTTDPHPTRAVAKARLVGSMPKSHERIPANGCWRFE